MRVPWRTGLKDRSHCLCWAALSLFATTSIGIFMGTIARSMPQLLLMILAMLPLQMLSGGSTPRESMPQAAGYYADHADDAFCQPLPVLFFIAAQVWLSSGRSSDPAG